MKSGRTHPGATGVVVPSANPLSAAQMERLRGLIESFGMTSEADALLEDIVAAVESFLGYDQVAQASSAGAIRKNLKGALAAATKAHIVITRLDGNSHFLANPHSQSGSLADDSNRIVCALRTALDRARDMYPVSGRAPAAARVYLAILLREALTKHAPTRVCSGRHGMLQTLLEEVLTLLDQPADDLHSLTERAMRVQSEEYSPGVRSLDLRPK